MGCEVRGHRRPIRLVQQTTFLSVVSERSEETTETEDPCLTTNNYLKISGSISYCSLKEQFQIFLGSCGSSGNVVCKPPQELPKNQCCFTSNNNTFGVGILWMHDS